MTKQGSIVLFVGLMALILIALIVAVTRLKPPTNGKTTPSVEPTAHANVRDDDRATGRRMRPSLPDQDGKHVDRSGSMGKASGNLAPPPRMPGQSRDSKSPRVRRFTIEPMIMYQVRKAMRVVVDKCVNKLAPSRSADPTVQSADPTMQNADPTVQSADPTVQTVIELVVKDGAATIRRTKVSLKRLSGNELSSCVSEGAAKLRILANDHDDVDGHTLTLPFRVRD